MTLLKFIDRLSEIKPHGNVFLEKFGIGHSKSILKEYLLTKKNIEKNPIFDNIIHELLVNYHVNNISFSDYSFNENIIEYNNVFVFGQSSGTYLAYETPDGKIIEYARDDDNLIDYCAENADAFLEALLVINEYRSNKFMNNLENNAKEVYVKRCCECAGGIKYEGFYRSIIR